MNEVFQIGDRVRCLPTARTMEFGHAHDVGIVTGTGYVYPGFYVEFDDGFVILCDDEDIELDIQPIKLDNSIRKQLHQLYASGSER